MSVMASANMLTQADLEALPDDGLRHELIDGAFIMTPAPGVPHQTMTFAIGRALHAASTGTGLKVLLAPVDVVLGDNVVQPDVVVAPREAFTEGGLRGAPVLAVEVRSASTAWLDKSRKRSLYEEFGVTSYWLVDPAEPSIRVLELVDGRYQEVAAARGDHTIEVNLPFPVSLNPADLARD